MVMTPTKHLPGLQTLRTFSALSVVTWHIPGFAAEWFSFARDESPIQHLFMTGTDGVTLFFVLSGFLLTHLLLIERRDTGRIDKRRFYARRARRILPLYYVVLAASGLLAASAGVAFPDVFGVFGKPDYVAATALVLANVPFALGSMGVLVHFWSLGVEWQFYALAPHLASARRVWLALGLLVGVRLVLLALFRGIEPLYELVLYCKVDVIAIGGLFAYAWHNAPRIVALLTSARVRRVVLALFALTVVIESPLHDPLFDLCATLIYGVLVLNVATARLSVVENCVTRWLGDVSYGVYLWHMLALFIVGLLGMRGVGLYVGTIGLTLALAAFSYYYIERPFLRRGYPLQSK